MDTLRRCVAMAAHPPESVPGPQSLLYQPASVPAGTNPYRNIQFIADTDTHWVRLWLSWRWMMPFAQTTDPASDQTLYSDASNPQWYANTPGSPSSYIANLDAEIALARANDINVILTFWEFPRWVNDTADKDPATYDPYNQYLPTSATDPTPDPNKPANRTTASGIVKPLEWRPPTIDLTTTGPYAAALRYLMLRYASDVYFLEVMNEPNLQWWPQASSDGTPDTPTQVGETVPSALIAMLNTAQAVQESVGYRPRILGPALSDGNGFTRAFVGIDSYYDLLPGVLRDGGLNPTQDFGWSMHNYRDVAYDRSLADQGHFIAEYRQTLRDAQFWTGWPNTDADDPNGDNPYVLVTEGGAQLDAIRRLYGLSTDADVLVKQADLVENAGNRLYNGAESPGIAMTTNYLFYTDPNFDTGLCGAPIGTDPNDPSGTHEKRPAFTSWAGLPSF
jgi:hypothetical protein